MKRILFLIWIIYVSVCLTDAQTFVSGKVINSSSKEPVANAFVYINNTTKSTSTNTNGNFVIQPLNFPCELVVSQMNYELTTIVLNDSTHFPLEISLKERSNELQTVMVKGNNHREENLKEFEKWFLGKDKWGRNARLYNDQFLLFWHQTDTVYRQPNRNDLALLEYGKTLGKGYGWNKDSTLIQQEANRFCAQSTGAFSVELPLLGYDVDINLRQFSLTTMNRQKTREYYLYSHFIERKTSSEKEQKQIENNRKFVYWNSKRHFLKSLYQNALAQNGFLLYPDKFLNILSKNSNQSPIDIYHSTVRSGDKLMIVGQKGHPLIISFYGKSNNRPIDLSTYIDSIGNLSLPQRYAGYAEKSSVTFLSDTCIIYDNGVNPDNTICFGGEMSKQVGATLLPIDYSPEITLVNKNTLSDDKSDHKKPEISEAENYDQPQTSRPEDLDKLVKRITDFTIKYPQEKAYLHFDNTAYFLGETMWFKAYVVTAERNYLSPLSKVLYTELITPEGNIIATKKFKIEDGQCHGEFLLQDSLRSGFYEVRAYTRYMLNQEKEYLFSRVFPVYEKPKKEGEYTLRRIKERYRSQRVPSRRKEYEQNSTLAMTFYPEGGNLIKGLSSRVAFKATGENGENAVVNGEVLDALGNKVADIENSHLGMGAFEFIPGDGKYLAKVRYNNKNYSFDLPQILPTGYTMTVDNNDNEKINILIQKSLQLPADTLGITISCRGKVYASDYVVANHENKTSLSFPKRMLPSGVSQITLFTHSREILSERLAFVNHNSQMKISTVQDKREYQPFEKVNMDFQLNDTKGNPLKTTFSVAVRDASSSTYNPYNDNILSNLLLSSELKGYIENPGYYFESDEPAKRAALDLLMLTQGWSRYVWKEMVGMTKYEVKHPIEESLVIEGQVLSLTKKKPKSDVEVLMFMVLPDSTSMRGTCLTDEDGKFNFALNDFNGKAKLTLQTKEKGKRTENNIVLDRVFSPEYKVYSYKEKQHPEDVFIQRDSISVQKDTINAIESGNAMSQNQENETKLAMDKKNHHLKEVTVKAKKPIKREAEGLRNANIVYDVEKIVDEMIDKREDEPVTVLDFLTTKNLYFSYTFDLVIPKESDPKLSNYSEKAIGQVIPKESDPKLGNYSQKAIHARYKGKDVLFCLNNKSLADFDAFLKLFNIVEPGNSLKDYYSNEIETITINETSGISLLYGGKTGNEVVIFIYTYKDLHVRNNLFGIRQTKLTGYAYTKEFYSPNYEKSFMPDNNDYRRTLYWNPDVKTDATGKATVSFFNNGSCKAMNISAETVTEKGVIGTLNK